MKIIKKFSHPIDELIVVLLFGIGFGVIGAFRMPPPIANQAVYAIFVSTFISFFITKSEGSHNDTIKACVLAWLFNTLVMFICSFAITAIF